VSVEQPRPVEATETVLDGALGQPGEANELAGGEHLVLAQQPEQLPVSLPEPLGWIVCHREPGQDGRTWCRPDAWTRRTRW